MVHHVLVGRFDRKDEEFAVLVSEELDGNLVDSHGLVVETQDLELQGNDFVSIGGDYLSLGHLGASTADAKRHALVFANLQLLDRARRRELVHDP